MMQSHPTSYQPQPLARRPAQPGAWRLLAACLVGCLLTGTTLAAELPLAKQAPFAPAQELQPWGAGDLSAVSPKEPGSFTLPEAWAANYAVVTGELRLPTPASVISLLDLRLTMAKDRVTATLTAGTGQTAKRADQALPGEGAWVPFNITRMGERLSCTLGAQAYSWHLGLPPGGRPLTLTVQGDAQVRGVKVATLPNHLAVLSLEHCAPATEAAARSAKDCPAFDPATLPPGLLAVDGIPFLVSERPLDLQYTQKGADFSRRLKFFTATGPSANRPVGVAPGKSYTWLHVLAYSRDLPQTVPRLTLSYGDVVGWAGLMEEEVVAVPDFSTGGPAPLVQSRLPIKLADGQAGHLYHLRIPVARSANYWFRPNSSFEFSRDKEDLHNLPDPNEFARVPVGLPSSVVVVAATAERAPVEFTYVLGEPGNVFHESTPVVLKIQLTNRQAGPFTGEVYATSAGPGLPESANIPQRTWTITQPITLAPGETRELPLSVMPPEQLKRGWFSLEIGVKAGPLPVQIYRTTYAVLAPDTRQALADSPFGIWEFWGVHTMFGQGKRHTWDIANLILKGGWRWTYGGNAQERGHGEGPTAEQLYDQFKLTYTVRNLTNGYQRGKGWWDAEEFEKTVAVSLRQLANERPRGLDRVYKVLHESRSSDTLLRRYSDYFGGAPYAMPEAEKRNIDEQFANVVKYCRAIKAADPDAKICLINDYPGVGIEYMKRGFPKELFDYFGSEMANFMREPERQPDWLCLLGQTHQWLRAQKQYGYEDKPIWTTEALYHSTNPGNLGLHAQSVIQAREAMLALALGIQRMAAAGCIRDVTDDYRWSNWGQVGFCFREPEINPKPSYAMYAWLTQVLDQAKFAGLVPHDSSSLHLLSFARRDGVKVYPLWCVRGRQEVTLAVAEGQPVVHDAYGNPLPNAVRDGQLTVLACDTPLYIVGGTITGVVKRQPIEQPALQGRILLEFEDPSRWRVRMEPSKTLEASWDYLRLKGDFAVEPVTEDQASALRLTLKPDADARKLPQRYVELELAQPIVFSEPITAFTARVKGNGGWGRLMFELRDAEGRVWTSCGNQYAGSCNASDNKGDSYISFDGWQTLTIAAPGRFPATDLTAYRSSTCHWWPENTPEWRQQLADHELAKAKHEQAVADFPGVLREYEAAKAAHEALQAAFQQAKAAYDAEVAAFNAATKAHPARRAEYAAAKKAYDLAVRAGQAPAAEPVPPIAPTPVATKAPVAPAPLAKAPTPPAAPAFPRNYGVSPLTYPVTLTRIIYAASPSLLYVTDEIPAKSPTIHLDWLGVR